MRDNASIQDAASVALIASNMLLTILAKKPLAQSLIEYPHLPFGFATQAKEPMLLVIHVLVHKLRHNMRLAKGPICFETQGAGHGKRPNS